ncbi:hypothetical protein [Spirillospora sp. CA-294931]|uniref:hypothetical protein n=1 Tax=Spirillospora sp. CA-294931 TaxID=3240042 RepID=UPI003D8D57C9
MLTIVLAAVIVAAVAAGIRLSSPGGEDGPGRRGRPLPRLAVVVAAIYVNQALFTVYVRVGLLHGDVLPHRMGAAEPVYRRRHSHPRRVGPPGAPVDGAARIRGEFGGPPGRFWGAQMALSSAAGFAGVSASWFLAARYTEARLLFAAAAFFVCAVSVCALVDRRYARASGTNSRRPGTGSGTGAS